MGYSMKTITLPITQVRNNFFNLIRDAKNVLERIIITKNGKPEAVLLSYDEYEGWLETFEIAKDKELMAGIRRAKEDIRAGRLHSYENVKAVLKSTKKPSGNHRNVTEDSKSL